MAPEKTKYIGRNSQEDTSSPYCLSVDDRLGWKKETPSSDSTVEAWYNESPIFQCSTVPDNVASDHPAAKTPLYTSHTRPPLLLKVTCQGPLYRTNRCKICSASASKGKYPCGVNHAAIYLTKERTWCKATEYIDNSIRYEYQGKNMVIDGDNQVKEDISDTIGEGSKDVQSKKQKSTKRSRATGTRDSSKDEGESDSGRESIISKRNSKTRSEKKRKQSKVGQDAKGKEKQVENVDEDVIDPPTPNTLSGVMDSSTGNDLPLSGGFIEPEPSTINLNPINPNATAGSSHVDPRHTKSESSPANNLWPESSTPPRQDLPLFKFPFITSLIFSDAENPMSGEDFSTFRTQLSTAIQPTENFAKLQNLPPPPENVPEFVNQMYDYFGTLTREVNERTIAVQNTVDQYEKKNSGMLMMNRQALAELMRSRDDLIEDLMKSNQDRDLYRDRYHLTKKLSDTHEESERELRIQVQELTKFKVAVERGGNAKSRDLNDYQAEITKLKSELAIKNHNLKVCKDYIDNGKKMIQEQEQRELQERQEREKTLSFLDAM